MTDPRPAEPRHGISGAHGLLFLLALAWPVVLVTPTGPPMSDSVLLAAIRLVDDHTWTLSDEPDPKVVFMTEAFDISVHDHRVYSGVGPGASVLAAPFYLALKPVLARFDERVIANRRFLDYYLQNRRAMQRPASGRLKDVYLLQILLAWVLVAPLLASFLARLHRLLTAHAVARAQATAIAMSAGLGSMALYYSAMYSRQALAYGLAWHAVVSLVGVPEKPLPSRGSCLVAGAFLGAAIGIDYASAILVVLSLFFLLPRLTVTARLLVLVPLLALLGLTALYHQAAFGSPFTTPYHERFWFTPELLARRGLDFSAFQAGPALGMQAPSAAVMLQLCFGSFKGLFVYSPVLVLGLVGHLAGLRAPQCRRLHVYSLLVFLGYLTFNSTLGTHVPEYGRHFWGGLSGLWGPRYLYGVVPFLACGLVGLEWRQRSLRMLCYGLLLVSCAFNVLGAMFSDVVMSTSAFAPHMRAPLAYVVKLVLLRGPRVPLLEAYGVAPAVQWAVLLALAALSLLVVPTLRQGGARSERTKT
jgi:hypothetical protein